MPFLVIAGNAGGIAINFPSEPDFVQKLLSIKSQFVLPVIASLLINPTPKSLVFLVTEWHETVAILSFKIEQFFILQIPFLIPFLPGFRHGSQLVVFGCLLFVAF